MALGQGSSPLARGKHVPGVRRTRLRRLIPARAGKTLRPVWEATRPAAHPRSRGENSQKVEHLLSLNGSSPLARGKQTQDWNQIASARLIPARAGKTDRPHFYAVDEAAHPRSRGENRGATGASWPKAGSSPLARGKRDDLVPPLAGVRLIPARAGKTYCAGQSFRHGRAHPRSRGENSAAGDGFPPRGGSSPLARGKQLDFSSGPVALGLIPARAGKTSSRPPGRQTLAAHPRSRGENEILNAVCCELSGSSPLARGKLVH